MRVERFLVGPRNNPNGTSVRADFPTLLVVAQVGHHDLIKDLFVEKPGAFEVSTAENVLKHL